METVEDLIDYLNQCNPKAKLSVIVHNKNEEFSMVWGGEHDDEDNDKMHAQDISFYVDRLCEQDTAIS